MSRKNLDYCGLHFDGDIRLLTFQVPFSALIKAGTVYDDDVPVTVTVTFEFA